MSCDWPRITIQSLLDNETIIKVKDGNYGSYYPRKSEFGEEGVLFLTAKLLDGSGNIDFENAPRLSKDKADSLPFGFLKEGDVLLSHNATIGRVAIVPKINEPVLIGTSLTHYRLNSNKLSPRYLAAFFSGKDFQDQLASVMSHTTRNQVPITAQKKLSVIVPPIQEQNAIASILECFDSKITLHKKQNQTLEQIAQAIFKSWFVDFEPVKAKIKVLEAGGSEEDAILAAMQAISDKDKAQLTQLQTENPENYNQLRTTAELFPSAMQDSELGEIPEGWNYGLLSDISELNKSSWTKRTLPSEIEYVDLANTKKGIIENTSRYAANEAPSRARRKLSKGDTIIGTVRPGNRSYAFIYDDSNMLTGSTGFAVLTPENRHFAEFLYIKATSEQSIDYLAHLADGGAYPAVRPEVVSSVPSILPSDALVRRFHHTVSPYFKSIGENNKESSLLTKVKLALLPKLLSGEILMAHANESLEVD